MLKIFKNRIVTNAAWIIGAKIVQSVLALIINMLTARFLGPSNYGLINYAASLAAFVFPLMQLGFADVIVQELTNDPDNEGAIIGSCVLLSFISALFCIVGITLFVFTANAGETVTIIVCVLYSVILLFQAMELIQYWFQAKLLSKYISIISLVAYIAVAVYQIILLLIKCSIYWFAISKALDSCLIAIAVVIVYRKKSGKKLTFSKTIAKQIFRKSKFYILSGMMIVVFAQTDKIMLKLMLDETSVGHYSAAVTCAGLLTFVYSAIIHSMRPVIFENKKTDEKNMKKA